ncbi:WXG100 family type VII secretion target [Bacillus fengqiuensis]|nr:WXG100 family type VII secretion target [Bacillus fengqiuensis]
MSSRILITPDQLEQTALLFRKASQEAHHTNLKLIQLLNGLQQQWNGVSRERFYQTFKDSQKEINAFPKLLDSISNDLKSIAQKFREADSNPQNSNGMASIMPFGPRVPHNSNGTVSIMPFGPIVPHNSNGPKVKEPAPSSNNSLKTEFHVKEEPGKYTYQKTYDPNTGLYGKVGNLGADFNYKNTNNRSDSVVGFGGGVSASAVEAGWDTKVIDSNVQLATGELEARASKEGVRVGGEAAVIKYEAKSEGFNLFGYEVKLGGSFSAASIGGRVETKWKDGFKFNAHGAFGLGGGFSFEVKKK